MMYKEEIPEFSLGSQLWRDFEDWCQNILYIALGLNRMTFIWNTSSWIEKCGGYVFPCWTLKGQAELMFLHNVINPDIAKDVLCKLTMTFMSSSAILVLPCKIIEQLLKEAQNCNSNGRIAVNDFWGST